jgi:hypothetical protein
MGNQPGAPGAANAVPDGLASKGIKKMSGAITRRLGDGGGRIYNSMLLLSSSFCHAQS